MASKSILRLIQAGEQQEARQRLRQHLKQRPDDARAWYALALTLEDRQQQTRALRRALKANPDFKPARQRLRKLQTPPQPRRAVPAALVMVVGLALLGLGAALGMVLLEGRQPTPTPPAIAAQPTRMPTDIPTESPTDAPADAPTDAPTDAPAVVQVRVLRPADEIADEPEPGDTDELPVVENEATPVQLPPAVIIPLEESAPQQIVIRFDAATSIDQRAAYVELAGGTVTRHITSLDSVVASLPAGALENAIVIPPMSDMPAPLVLAHEPDYYVQAQAQPPAPSDPLYADQWALPVIRAPQAWPELNAAAPVVVAVIDSGICADHPDLTGRVLPGWDFVEDDADPQDEFGHGCAIAGLLAANIDDGIGIAGIAPNVQIMPLRVLDANGLGLYSSVAAAIIHAADNGAHIINLSLGGMYHASILHDAIDYALNRGVRVVAAAGNTGDASILYPAAYPGVVAVGAVDRSLERSHFSSSSPRIDLLAPGSDILASSPDGGYVSRSGTSFAVPHVAGVAALEMAFDRDLALNGGVVAFYASTDDSPIVIDPGDDAPPLLPWVDFEPVIVEGIGDGNMIIEGDIVVPLNFYEMRAQGAFTNISLWPGSVVPYTFQPGTSSQRQAVVRNAMDTWEAVSGVRFVPRSGQANWIEFVSADYSASCVGMGGDCWWGAPGRQYVWLADTWGWTHPIVVHEIGHALGLWHEQSRFDRDNYVRIEWDNIPPSLWNNFEKYPVNSSSNDHGPYDFDSIMHYHDNAFAINWRQPTITVLPPNQHKQSTIGRGSDISVGDGRVMAFLYPPPPPALIAPANNALTNNPRPTFEWSSLPSADSYQLQVTTNPNWTGGTTVPVSSSQHTWGSNLADNTHYWRVRALTGGAWTAWSAGRTLTVDTTPPTVPVLLAPANGSELEDITRPTFQWSAPLDAVAYQLQLTLTDFSGGDTITVDTTTNQHTWAADLGYQSYQWRVRARDLAGNWSAWSAAFNFSILSPVPPPVLLSPEDGAVLKHLQPLFAWEAVPFASEYELHISASLDGFTPNWASGEKIRLTDTAYLWPGDLTNITRYHWRVRAFVEGYWSVWSAGHVLDVNTIPDAIRLRFPLAGYTSPNQRPGFWWHHEAGAVLYQLEVTAFGFGAASQTTVEVGTNYYGWPSDLSHNRSYTWRVRGRDAYGNWGGWSESRNLHISTGANQTITAAHEIVTVPYTSRQNVALAATAPDDPTLACASHQPGQHTVWYRYTPERSRWIIINTLGSNYDTVLSLWLGAPGNLSPLACNDDDGQSYLSQINAYLMAGTTYWIQVASYDPFSPSQTVSLQMNLSFGWALGTLPAQPGIMRGPASLAKHEPPPTVTPPPTATLIPSPSATSIPPTVSLTDTPTPSETPIPPTDTPPPTATLAPPTDTPIPPTDTAPPTETLAPPTNTSPPTATPVPAAEETPEV